MPTLRDGSHVEDGRLGRLPSPDLRSLNYLVGDVRKTPTSMPVAQHKPRSYTYRCHVYLDQGREGACVGTGCGHELAAAPMMVGGVHYQWTYQNIYHPAQHEDWWDGCALGPRCPIQPSPNTYEGTSVLAGVQQMQRLGFITSYHWAVTLEEAILGLGYHGPAIIGVDWHRNMQDTDEHGFITPTGPIDGGHCVLVTAVKIFYKRTWKGWWRRSWDDVDLDRSYITIHNSWGRGWGEGGRAKMYLRNFGLLIAAGGETCFVERTNKRVV